MAERLVFVLEQRGFDVRNVRAVTHGAIERLAPLDARRKLDVLPEFTESADFQSLAAAFKRVRNIARELPIDAFASAEAAGAPLALTEPAERALADEIERRRPSIDAAVEAGDGFRKAFAEAARFKPVVDTFFDDVLVMAPDPAVRESRLRLLRRLERLILQLADISEIVTEDKRPA
jgi:glycyl-tRNA synthetase beta chain